jgi:hypothetical protein
MICLGMHSNVMLRFLVQAFRIHCYVAAPSEHQLKFKRKSVALMSKGSGMVKKFNSFLIYKFKFLALPVMLQNMIDVASNSWILHATLHAVLYIQ